MKFPIALILSFTLNTVLFVSGSVFNWFIALLSYFFLIVAVLDHEFKSDASYIWFVVYSCDGGLNRIFLELGTDSLDISDIQQIEEHIVNERRYNWVSVVNYKCVGRV